MSMRLNLRRWVVRHRPRQLAVQRAISLPGLRRRPRAVGTVWAVTMVRNEEDIVGHTIRHLLQQGIDGVIVVDHLSTDGTKQVLDLLGAEDSRVHVGNYSATPYQQPRVMSYLAQRARSAGADWVVLFDADEWWFAEEGTVAEHLRTVSGSRVVAAQLHNGHALTDGGVDMGDPSGWLLVEGTAQTQKVAIRPDRWVWVDTGNHSALDLGEAVSSRLRILHLPYRSEDQMRAKAVNGAAAVRADREMQPHIANHWKRLADNEEAVAEEWSAAHHREKEREVLRLPLPDRWEGWPSSLTQE